MVILRATDNFGNKQDLDILQEGGLNVDISAIESTDIGSLYGVTSQEFMLPGSDKNNQFFGNMYDLGADPSVALNHTIYATVLINGQEGFAGRMYINDILKDDKGYVMYKAVVLNEVVDFKQRIQSLALSDLDFSDLDHTYNYANITSSWDGSLLNGDVVYPLADYGGTNTSTTIAYGAPGDATFNNRNTPISFQDFKPAVRVKKIFDAIFDEVNYNYSSSFLDSDYFQKLFILATPSETRGFPGANPTVQKFRGIFTLAQSQTVTDGSTDLIIFPSEKYDNSNSYDTGTGIYTVPTNDDYEFAVGVELEWAAGPGSGNVHRAILDLRINGTSVDQKYIFSNGTTGNGSLVYFANNLTAGDTVEVYITNQTLSGGISGPVIAGSSMDVVNTSGTTNNSYFDGHSFATLTSTGTAQINKMFGEDLTVVDFLKGIIEKFNLIMEPKQDEQNTIIIEPFNDWVNSGQIVDWSDKVDHSVRKSIRGTMVDQEFAVNFKDSEDADFLNTYTQDNYKKTFGEALYISDSDLTDGTKEIGGFFAPTPITSIDGATQTYIPMLYSVNNDEKVPIAFKPRLLHYNGRKVFSGDAIAYLSNGSYSHQGYWLRDENSTIHEINDYAQFHYLETGASSTDTLPDYDTSRDLNWNNLQQRHFNSPTQPNAFYAKRDIIWEYWSFYLNELYDPESKRLTCNLLFTPDEVKDIKLNSKVFIDGHYYRIDKISSFSLTEDSSVQVELITAPVRKFRFPRRRVYNIQGPNTGLTGSGATGTSGGGFTDITLDPGSLGLDGSGVYVTVDDDLPATGSGNQGLVGRVAPLDGVRFFPNNSGSIVWQNNEPVNTIGFRRQISQGNNIIDYSANNVSALGNNNTIKDSTNIVNVKGSGNVVQSFAEYTDVQGDGNTVENFTKKSSIIASTNSQLKNNTEYGTIIGGEDTIISGSNKSIVIGQDTITQGGNSNIVIGNFDTTTKTVKDMINTVVINPNRDIESRENLGAEDFSGRAYIGNYQDIGSRYSDNNTLTLSAGDTLYLTGSAYSSDSVYNVTWTGGDGTANVYLPDVDVNYAALDKGQGGYKRYLRFTTDGTLDQNKNININVASGDYLNGQINGGYTMDAPYQNFEIYGVSQSYWRVLEAGVPDTSNGGQEGAYGSFYSTSSQAIAVINTPQLVEIESTFASNKVSLSGSSAIQMDYNGAYSFTYTAKVENTANAVHYADFWIKYNGTDYPNSTVRVTIPARKSASEPFTSPVTVSLLDVAVNDNDKIELYWRGDSTSLSLNYETFGGTIPAQPSVRAVIQAV